MIICGREAVSNQAEGHTRPLLVAQTLVCASVERKLKFALQKIDYTIFTLIIDFTIRIYAFFIKVPLIRGI